MITTKRITELKEQSNVLDRQMDRFRSSNAVGGFNAIVKKQQSHDKKQKAIWDEIAELKAKL